MAPTPRVNTAEPARARRPLTVISRLSLPLILCLLATGCSTLDSIQRTVFGGGPRRGQPGFVDGFLGAVVADEPNAALVGKEVLSAGGNAADAAVAVGLSLGVTLPSRAGVGGGGACVAYHPAGKRAPDAILFVPPAVVTVGGGDRRAAVPMLPRGMFVLHAGRGRLPFEFLIDKAERLARFGSPVSRAFARDLALVAGPLFADPGARNAYGRGGVPLVEGQTMTQPDLAATLAQLRVAGVGDLYQGALARRVEQMSPLAGVPIGLADLRAALPAVQPPAVVAFGEDQVAFPPTDGGLAAAAALMTLRDRPADVQAALLSSLAAAARWRAGGANSDQVLNGELVAPASVPLYPATTSFAAMDDEGNAVVCAMTMNNLFGTGRMVPGLGFLTAASPANVTPPLLAAGLAWSPRRDAFRAAAGGSGQAGSGLAAAAALANTLRSGQPMQSLVPEPGRANVISCARYLPGSEANCGAVADPREFGLVARGS